MSKEFMNLGEEYRKAYEQTIDQLLKSVIEDNRFADTIRNLCNQAIKNNWSLDKKINIVNIITQ